MTEAKANPPRAAVALLRYFADPEDSLSLLGDVEEEFKDAYSQKGTEYHHYYPGTKLIRQPTHSNCQRALYNQSQRVR